MPLNHPQKLRKDFKILSSQHVLLKAIQCSSGSIDRHILLAGSKRSSTSWDERGVAGNQASSGLLEQLSSRN